MWSVLIRPHAVEPDFPSADARVAQLGLVMSFAFVLLQPKLLLNRHEEQPKEQEKGAGKIFIFGLVPEKKKKKE